MQILSSRRKMEGAMVLMLMVLSILKTNGQMRIEEKYKMEECHGIQILSDWKVQSVKKGSQADKAEIKKGWKITKWNGVKFSEKNINDFKEALDQQSITGTVTFSLNYNLKEGDILKVKEPFLSIDTDPYYFEPPMFLLVKKIKTENQLQVERITPNHKDPESYLERLLFIDTKKQSRYLKFYMRRSAFGVGHEVYYGRYGDWKPAVITEVMDKTFMVYEGNKEDTFLSEKIYVIPSILYTFSKGQKVYIIGTEEAFDNTSQKYFEGIIEEVFYDASVNVLYTNSKFKKRHRNCKPMYKGDCYILPLKAKKVYDGYNEKTFEAESLFSQNKINITAKRKKDVLDQDGTEISAEAEFKKVDEKEKEKEDDKKEDYDTDSAERSTALTETEEFAEKTIQKTNRLLKIEKSNPNNKIYRQFEFIEEEKNNNK